MQRPLDRTPFLANGKSVDAPLTKSNLSRKLMATLFFSLSFRARRVPPLQAAPIPGLSDTQLLPIVCPVPGGSIDEPDWLQQ